MALLLTYLHFPTPSTMLYDVPIGIYLAYGQMEEIVDKFVNSIFQKDIVVFFYIGYGIQWKNQNYLLPTNDHKLTCDFMLQYLVLT